MEENKKIKIGTIIIIIAIIVIAGLVGVLFSNNAKMKSLKNELNEIKGTDKKAITSEEFKNFISAKNFTINVLTDAYTQEVIEKDTITGGYLTKSIEDETFRINFFEYQDENCMNALFYNEIKTTRNGSNGNIKETLEKSMNHAKYIALTNGKCIVVSRVGNTLVWATINANKEQQLMDLLNEIGY